jgi:hypothetical protein
MTTSSKAQDVQVGQIVFKDMHWILVEKVTVDRQKNGKELFRFDGPSLTTREKYGYELNSTVWFKIDSKVKIRN